MRGGDDVPESDQHCHNETDGQSDEPIQNHFLLGICCHNWKGFRIETQSSKTKTEIIVLIDVCRNPLRAEKLSNSESKTTSDSRTLFRMDAFRKSNVELNSIPTGANRVQTQINYYNIIKRVFL